MNFIDFNNQSDRHPFLQGTRLLKEFTEAESTQHQSLLSYQPSPNSTFSQSLMELPLKQVCLRKHLKMVSEIAMIYLALIKWRPKCLLCAKSLNGCFICIQSPKEVAHPDFKAAERATAKRLRVRPVLWSTMLLNLSDRILFMLKVRPLVTAKGEVSESSSVLHQALFSIEKARAKYSREGSVWSARDILRLT